jgi:sterol desaturase/sphingolipid hydroxylase (fatty acid hydroxylase superfamily)
VKLIWIAAPVFLALALIEWLVARRRGWHSARDSAGNIGCGVVEQAFGALVYPLVFIAYRTLEGPTLPASSPWTWIYAFVLADLAFYLFHRAAHRVPVIWAAHCVHHASPHMNLTVAMRGGAFQRLFAVWFYLPLALLGVPGDVLLVVLGAQIMYQFILHTRFGGAFGPLGWVLATPSHHRVHHAIDDEYRDKNFGAVLIVWDRLFGTFAAETHAPRGYGTVDPTLMTANPIKANLVGFLSRRPTARSRSDRSSATRRSGTSRRAARRARPCRRSGRSSRRPRRRPSPSR